MICIKYVADYQGVNIFINCTCINSKKHSIQGTALLEVTHQKLSCQLYKRFFPILVAWLLIDIQSSTDEPWPLHNEIASYAPACMHV